MDKKRIFVSAFSCMPHMGSEPGVGWHWVLEMSKYYELWVLVHKEPIDDIEEYVKKEGLDKRIHFIYFDIPFNNLFFKNGIFRGIRTYYLLWTLLANKIVKKTMEDNGIEIFHNLTFGNILWPVSRYGQKQFFVWGPVGGAETISSEYSRHYTFKSRLFESIRRLIVKCLKYDPLFRKRCKNANLILCKTEDTIGIIPVKYRHKAQLCTDVAVEKYDAATQMEKKTAGRIEYLAVGRMDGWRGFDLLVEAFARAQEVCAGLHLTILGDGTERESIKKLVERKGLSNTVNLVGNVGINEYNRYMQNCDVVVNSCLKEGAVTVSFDSMRYGKPLICIDTGGFTKYFSDEYAIVLPRAHRQTTIKNLAEALLQLTDRVLITEMGDKARQAGKTFTWEQKGVTITRLIESSFIATQQGSKGQMAQLDTDVLRATQN